MKNIQELWDEIPEKSLQEDEISALLNIRSQSEVDRFKKVLLVELFISWGLAIFVFFIDELIGKEVTILIYSTIFLGSILNIVTLKKLRKFQLLDDVRSFLNNALKTLKSFVTGFILSIQIVGVLVITAFRFLEQDHIPWKDWLFSERGISVIIVFFIIEIILISYAWIFYIKRIYSLKKILREMDYGQDGVPH